MKGINIFIADVIKDYPYNYGIIVQVLWKEGSKKKVSLFWKCLKWCHVALWNFRLHFEPSGLPPLKDIVAPLNKVIFPFDFPLEMNFSDSTFVESVPTTTTLTTITLREKISTTNATT